MNIFVAAKGFLKDAWTGPQILAHHLLLMLTRWIMIMMMTTVMMMTIIKMMIMIHDHLPADYIYGFGLSQAAFVNEDIYHHKM